MGTVLGPCTFGDHAVVAAGAVVVPGTTIPPDSIWGGIPAKMLKGLSDEGKNEGGYRAIDEAKTGRAEEKDMTKEQLVLARVRIENGSISVCADEKLSMQVQERMLRQDWPVPVEIQETDIPADEAADAQPAMDDQDMCLEAELEIISQNKDIMCKVPQKTKFRLIKLVLNRLLRLTNRYQQMFNQAVHEVVCALTGTIRWLKPALRMTDEKANRALSRCDTIEEYLLQMDKRLAQETRQKQELQEELQLLLEWQQEMIKQMQSAVAGIQDAVDRAQRAEASTQNAIEQAQRVEASVQDAIVQTQRVETSVQDAIEQVQKAEASAQNAIEQTQKVEASVQDAMQQIEEINLQNCREYRHRAEQDNVVKSVARDLIRTKWQLRDLVSEQKDESDRQLRCGICGYSAPLHTFEVKESDCIFAGGHLKRFVCPDCGCIFGPTKFADQTKQEFDDDYTVHYAGFHETDCTYKEQFAFEQLNPVKNGVYLNYGCGRWSHTIANLRAQGYQVYGYEPYAADIDNPYIITDIKELSKMRFDGIFSNDLLEHLADPIRELQFMKLLLRTSESKMAHCTGCFHYKYEYTRFHMFFFTGDSVRVLAEKAGLSLLSHHDEPQSGDPCNVFGIRNNRVDLLHHMESTDKEQSDAGIKAGINTIIYGPYLTLPAGEYTFTARLTLPPELDGIRCNITSEHGKNTLQGLTLYSGYNHICINLDAVQTDLEFVMRNTARQGDILLEQMTLEPKSIDTNMN